MHDGAGLQVSQFSAPFDNLFCIACGAPPTKMMALSMRADTRPHASILIAYALCAGCDQEACGAAAIAAIREAVGEDRPVTA